MSGERTRDRHLIVVLQCDECGEPCTGCRDLSCALVSRPYAGEDVVPVEQLQRAEATAEKLAEALEHLPSTYLSAFAAERLVEYRESHPTGSQSS